ncbi:MAG TPA: protein kinase [Pyrinomonadaceae bacterium]|jgi:serine/threonine-protein kinase|nr:protein kinase [Pyrinomonadaceae bacterium]
MNCPECQKPVREGAKFCTGCGTPAARDGARPPESAPTVGHGPSSAAETDLGRVAPPTSEVGTLLGRVLDGKYEIVSPIGEGGMGSVYRARRLLIGDEVAVKVLHAKFVNDAALVERFRREARAAAQLHHPNVVTIHDYGEARGREGFAFIVMELVHGESLRALLRRGGRMDAARAVSLMRDICAGVGAAHRRGIVHRDLKPDNIIVVPADEDSPAERVKVVDFGIAKLRDMAADGTLTEAGAVVGTPFYMSPEQCKGEPLDARADVYSLGALLHEMLAGSPPFNATSLAGIILKHVSEPPPPLPADVAAPPALRDAVTRALSKDPAARQRDASEFSREIQAASFALRPSQEHSAPPFSEDVRPAPVTPLPSQPSTPVLSQTASAMPGQSQPGAHAETYIDSAARQTQAEAHQTQSQPQQTRPHALVSQTHGGGARRSRTPLVLLVLAVLFVSAVAAVFIGLVVMRGNRRGAVVVNSRQTPAPSPSNGNNANATATPATIVVSEQMLRAEEKIVAGTALKGEDLAGLMPQQLRLLRNAAFARHGRVFQAGEMQQYFQSRPWYRARTDFSDRSLTPADRANSDLIRAYEESGGVAPTFDAAELSKQVAEAIDDWADSTSKRDLDAHARSYAGTLEVFYKKTNIPVSQVITDRMRAFTRYDSMDVKITNVQVEPDPSGRRAAATFDKRWEFRSKDKTSTGFVRQQLTFVRRGDRWLITGERDLQVYETGSEEY